MIRHGFVVRGMPFSGVENSGERFSVNKATDYPFL